MGKTTKPDAGTTARTIILVVALANQILVSTGHSALPIEDQQITEAISLIFTIGASIAAWWKNNDFTKEAQAGTAYMKDLKDANKEG